MVKKARPASLSCPLGDGRYLILRESVWLCLHLDEAGWMLCLMLSLLLSTTAGSEEPFITTSALEGGENTKVDMICESAHDKSNSFVFARARCKLHKSKIAVITREGKSIYLLECTNSLPQE